MSQDLSEDQVKKAVCDLLEVLKRQGKPVVWSRTNAGQIQTIDGYWIRLCEPGWPDITGIVAGDAVGIETKRPKTPKQRKTQTDMQEKWEFAGGIYLLVNNLEVLRAFLRERGLL